MQHNTSHFPNSFTPRNLGPWILVHLEQFATSKTAMRCERWLKSGSLKVRFRIPYGNLFSALH
jgi:predicted GIY-YIG superfamily endonuclease